MYVRPGPSHAASLQEIDDRYVWHPFTQAKNAPTPHVFERGEGARLYDDRAHGVLDLIASWWVNLHGHAHPAIAAAISEQANRLEHVLFAGAAHPPAIQYARELVAHLHPPLERVFYSDDGSTAVEAALKIALQYWQNRGTARKRILAFDGGYHGDTFGAMSVGRGSAFFIPFTPWLLSVDLLPYATSAPETVEDAEEAALARLDRYLDEHGDELAACILEPLVQGAGGMRMARPAFVRAVAERVRMRGTLVIFDEVFTGFGRTGTLFAYEQVGFVPDLLCVAKGITGGFLPLAATIATPAIYEAFLDDRFERALLHGHSFTANPLGCAAARCSLELFAQENTFERIAAISAVHRAELQHLARIPSVTDPRSTGTIAAFEANVAPPQMRAFVRLAYERGLLLRPLGSTVYLVPPYCITPDELRYAYATIASLLAETPA